MIGLVQMALHIEPRPMATPLESVSGLLEEEQFSSEFSEIFSEAIGDAFAAVDDGDSDSDGEINDAGEALSPETVESDKEQTAPLKPDLDIPLISIVKAGGSPEALIEPDTGYGAAQVEPLGKTAAEKSPAVAGARQVEAAQDESIASSKNVPLLPIDKPKVTRMAFDPPLIFNQPSNQDDLLAQPSDNAPIKGNPTPLVDIDIPKEAQFLLDAGLVKPAGIMRETKSGPAQDRVTPPLRTIAQPNQIQQTVPFVPMPVMTMAEAVTAQIAPVATPAAPSLPVLDMEARNQWVTRLRQDIDQLSAEKPVLSFQLKPEHLGKLSVRITADVAGDIVRLEAESENVKALLIGSQGRLEQDIRLSGLKLARVDVTVQDYSGSQLGQQGHGSRESGSETGRNSSHQRQELSAEQNLPPQNGPDLVSQNGVAAASSHHGARYA